MDDGAVGGVSAEDDRAVLAAMADDDLDREVAVRLFAWRRAQRERQRRPNLADVDAVLADPGRAM
jgi:hypothetical protein